MLSAASAMRAALVLKIIPMNRRWELLSLKLIPYSAMRPFIRLVNERGPSFVVRCSAAHHASKHMNASSDVLCGTAPFTSLSPRPFATRQSLAHPTTGSAELAHSFLASTAHLGCVKCPPFANSL